MATEEISIQLRLDQLRRELAKIPGMTEEVMKKMSDKAEKEWTDVERAAARAAAKTTRQWEKAAADQEKAFETGAKGLKKFAGATGFGSLAGDIEDVVEGMGAMGPAAGVAVGGLAAIGASAAALYKVADAIGRASLNLEEYAEATHGVQSLGPPISAEALQASRDANAALEGLQLVASRVAATYGEEFVPLVRQGALVAAELALRGKDVIDWLAEHNDLLLKVNLGYQLILPLWDRAASALAINTERAQALVTELEGLAKAQEMAAAAGDIFARAQEGIAKMEAEATEDMKRAWAEREKRAKAYNERLAKARADSLQADIDMAELAVEEENKLREEQAEQAEAMIARIEMEERWAAEARQERFDSEIAQIMARIDARAAEGEAIREAEEKAAAMWDTAREAVDTYSEAVLGLIDNIGSLIEIGADRHRDTIDGLKAERDELRNGYQEMSAAEKARAAEKLANIRDQIGAERQAIRKSFAQQQALAIASAIVDAAASAIALIPAYAALGPAAPAAAAGTAAAALAVQLATIEAMKPKFHSGGEVQATLLQGEGVLNRRAMSQPGVKEWMQEVNTGQASGPADGGSGATIIRLNDRDLRSLDRRTAQVTGRDRRRGQEARLGTVSHYQR